MVKRSQECGLNGALQIIQIAFFCRRSKRFRLPFPRLLHDTLSYFFAGNFMPCMLVVRIMAAMLD